MHPRQPAHLGTFIAARNRRARPVHLAPDWLVGLIVFGGVAALPFVIG